MKDFNRRKQKCFNEFRKALMNRKTESEKIFESLLQKLNIAYIEQKGLLAKSPTFSILDFYLPKPYRLAIEIDGKYHNTPRQIIKDAIKEEFLKQRRIHLLRLTDEEIMSDIDVVEAKLLQFMAEVSVANKSARLRKDRPILVYKSKRRLP